MKLLLIFLLTSIMIGQESVILVPAQLQSEFFKARANELGVEIELMKAQIAQDKALAAIDDFCTGQHKVRVQNQETADFGCLAPPTSSDPKQNLALR